MWGVQINVYQSYIAIVSVYKERGNEWLLGVHTASDGREEGGGGSGKKLILSVINVCI